VKEITPRERILEAAFAALAEQDFAATRTLDIATRARISTRELHSFFGGKQQILVTRISEPARGMRLPADLPAPHYLYVTLGLAPVHTFQENSCLTTSNSESATMQRAERSSSRHSNRSA
jgi:AcrR family transcriptional regulator